MNSFPPIPDLPQPPGNSNEGVWQGIKADTRELLDNFGLPFGIVVFSVGIALLVGNIIRNNHKDDPNTNPPTLNVAE